MRPYQRICPRTMTDHPVMRTGKNRVYCHSFLPTLFRVIVVLFNFMGYFKQMIRFYRISALMKRYAVLNKRGLFAFIDLLTLIL